MLVELVHELNVNSTVGSLLSLLVVTYIPVVSRDGWLDVVSSINNQHCKIHNGEPRHILPTSRARVLWIWQCLE